MYRTFSRTPESSAEISRILSNGVVTLAFQLKDSRLMSQAKRFLDYMIEHQETDGWFGPHAFNLTDAVADAPPLLWPRYLAMLGLVVCKLSPLNRITAG